MGWAEWWYAFRTTRLSKPAEDRALFRVTRHKRIQSVLEIGIDDGSRCQRLIEWLRSQPNSAESLRYAAIDQFEADGGLSLKKFHSIVNAAGAKPLPIPGNLAIGLPRVAHTIGAVDLLILDQDICHLTEPSVAAMMPRVVHDQSVVVAPEDETGFLREVSVNELLNKLTANRQAA